MMTQSPELVAGELLTLLEDAWNRGDGTAFAAPFAEDASFVDVRGAFHRGREAVARGHDAIFQTLYRDSQVRYSLLHARRLGDEVILAHSEAHLDIPAGPLQGQLRATQTLVLVQRDALWRIASFQNTPVATGGA